MGKRKTKEIKSIMDDAEDLVDGMFSRMSKKDIKKLSKLLEKENPNWWGGDF